jgi:hypothetical protein
MGGGGSKAARQLDEAFPRRDEDELLAAISMWHREDAAGLLAAVNARRWPVMKGVLARSGTLLYAMAAHELWRVVEALLATPGVDVPASFLALWQIPGKLEPTEIPGEQSILKAAFMAGKVPIVRAFLGALPFDLNGCDSMANAPPVLQSLVDVFDRGDEALNRSHCEAADLLLTAGCTDVWGTYATAPLASCMIRRAVSAWTSHPTAPLTFPPIVDVLLHGGRLVDASVRNRVGAGAYLDEWGWWGSNVDQLLAGPAGAVVQRVPSQPGVTSLLLATLEGTGAQANGGKGGLIGARPCLPPCAGDNRRLYATAVAHVLAAASAGMGSAAWRRRRAAVVGAASFQ